MYKYYVCQICGGQNTPHQVGRDFPKTCYYCHGGFLVYVTLQNLKDIMQRLYAKKRMACDKNKK